MLNDFKEFALRGNVVDMAVGIIIGAAFGGIVNSLVADVIMPPIGLLLGKTDFSNIFMVLKESSTLPGPYLTIADAKKAGAITMNIGLFINTVINFIILAFAIFMVIRSLNAMKRKQEAPSSAPTTKECPFCCSTVAIKAVRCPHCTAELKG